MTELAVRDATVERTPVARDDVLRFLGIAPGDVRATALLAVCERYGFDPLLKHVVLIAEGNRSNVFVTRDGLLHAAHSHPAFDGIEVSDPVKSEDGQHWIARATVHRKDRTRPTSYPGRFPVMRPKYEWVNGQRKLVGHEEHPYGPEMAIKVAESMTLRRAFDISLGSQDEMWDNEAVYTAEPPTPVDADTLALIEERIAAMPEAQKAAMRVAWKAATLPAPKNLRTSHLETALEILDQHESLDDIAEAEVVDPSPSPSPAAHDAGPVEDGPVAEEREPSSAPATIDEDDLMAEVARALEPLTAGEKRSFVAEMKREHNWNPSVGNAGAKITAQVFELAMAAIARRIAERAAEAEVVDETPVPNQPEPTPYDAETAEPAVLAADGLPAEPEFDVDEELADISPAVAEAIEALEAVVVDVDAELERASRNRGLAGFLKVLAKNNGVDPDSPAEWPEEVRTLIATEIFNLRTSN